MEELNKLFDAVSENDAKRVESLLELGYSVNARRRFSRAESPLHVAISKGHEEMVSLLLKHGAIPHSDDIFTPLHAALYKGNKTIFNLILQHHGCDVNLQDRYGFTPLHRACYTWIEGETMRKHLWFPIVVEEVCSPQLSSVELLLKYGSDVNVADNWYGEIPLHIACKTSNDELVNLLLQYGSDVNARRSDKCQISHLRHWCSPNDADTSDNTPLHIAIEFQRTKIIKLLLKNGAQVNVQTTWGQSPLHALSTRPFNDATLDIFKILLEHGCDPNITDCDRRIALEYVLKNKSFDRKWQEIITIFLEYGADVNAKNDEDESLLHIAAEGCPASINGYLIKAGADVNARDKKGNTPMHVAVYRDSIEIMEVLIKSGANVNAQDILGNTPFHILFSIEDIYSTMVPDQDFRPNCAKFLLENGGDPNISNKNGVYPLEFLREMSFVHIFVERMNLQFISVWAKMLLQNGRDSNISNNHGVYPFLLITKMDFINIFLEYCIFTGKELCYPHSWYFQIEAGADVNVRNKKGEMPIHITCANYNLGHIEELLKKSSDINAETNNGDIDDVYSEEILGYYYKDRACKRNSVYAVSNGLIWYIVMFVVKMRVANLSVNEILMNNIRRNSYLNYDYEESYEKFHEKFISELNSLKDQFVASTLTLYDVLTIDSDDLALRVKDEKVQQFMNSRSYYNLAPIYGLLLEYQFHKAVTRKTLMDDCEEILFNLTKLPSLVTRRIIHYLSPKDRRQLKNIYGKESDNEPTVT